MKTLLSAAAAVLAAALLIAVLPLRGEEKIYTDTIRLHVLAASDSDEDQKRKLLVRDAVLAVVEDAVGSAENVREAAETIGGLQDEIAAAAEAVLRENGSEEYVSVLWGKETYPDREYDGFTLPAGEYQSLRVVIGEGEGHNWWCVLFPQVCLRAASDPTAVFREEGFSDAAVETVTAKGNAIRVKWKILEIFSRWLP